MLKDVMYTVFIAICNKTTGVLRYKNFSCISQVKGNTGQHLNTFCTFMADKQSGL